jgi:hypothetical protein
MRRVKFYLRFTTVIIFTLAFSGANYRTKAQVEGDNPLEPIPGDRRVRLLERLSESFGYLSARELDKFYDLMPVECRDGMHKDEWVAKTPVDVSKELLEFSILEVRKDSTRSTEGELWVVSGCLKYQKGAKVVKSKAAYRVVWSSNEWFVCGLKKEAKKGIETPCPF